MKIVQIDDSLHAYVKKLAKEHQTTIPLVLASCLECASRYPDKLDDILSARVASDDRTQVNKEKRSQALRDYHANRKEKQLEMEQELANLRARVNDFQG